MKRSIISVAAGLTILCLGAASFAASKVDIDRGVVTSLNDFNALNAANGTLGKKAAGMLVFPSVTKGGVGIAGEFGEGVLQVNGKTLGYYSIASGSIGLTLGLAKHSQIIMFMTKDSLDHFTSSDGWSIGADAGVTVVSAKAGGDYDSLAQTKPILAFAFADKGLIGDLSVDGSKITKIKD